MESTRVLRITAAALAWAASGCVQGAQGDSPFGASAAIDRSVTLLPPQGATRTIDFTTDEGTWMALDVAPDGRWLVFDLLGHVYRLPIDGGEAVGLTQNSGSALNFHPAISRDGRRIAFISDRRGQNNVWVMEADGKNPTEVFHDTETRFMHPAWAPDGRSIVAVRVYATPGRGWHRQTSELWRLPLDGGAPTRLLAGRLMHYDAPVFSPDGQHLYFQVSYSTGEGLGLLTAGHRIQRMEIASGRVENVRTREPATLSPEFVEALRTTGYAADNAIDPPAAVTPVLSADGTRLAFALEQREKAMSYRGHQFSPRTAIVVRDFASGEERAVLDPAAKDLTQVNAQYAYGLFPRFAFMPDGESIVAWEGGKLRRVSIATGEVATIPFSARVHRVLSEVARSRLTIDDSAFAVKLIQWPAGSPDGRRLAFVAVGKVWVLDLTACPTAESEDSSREAAVSGGCTPKPLTPDMRPAVQLTPAWSPDGRRIAFTTWDDSARGAVWVADDGKLRQLTLPPAEYIHPTWTPDGNALVVNRGSGARSNRGWNGWSSVSGWEAIRIPLDGGTTAPVAELSGPQPTSIGAEGRLYYAYQKDAAQAQGLMYYPFPSPRAESLLIRVRSAGLEGGPPKDHVAFPPRRVWSDPVLGPDGRWVAFHSGRFLFVSPVVARAAGAVLPQVNPDPNDSVPGRRRVGDRGGMYHSWRDSTTLQFASGNRYVTYDVKTGQSRSTAIELRIPRPTPRGAIALANAKIITVDSAKVIERGTVVVRGARIDCVVAAGVCDTTGVDRVLDLSGKTIIPGMFDLHAHHAYEPSGVITPHRPSSALDLAYGVTTILDPNGFSESAFPLADLIDAGAMLGPRTYTTAELLIHPGTAWGDQQILRSQADADREIDRRVDWGAVSIKNFRQSARYQQQFILQAGRRRGVTVTGEGGPLYFDIGVVLDGQPGWEHFIANLPVYKDATTFLGKAGIVYSPTSIVAGHVMGSMEYFRPLQRLDLDAKYRRFMPTAELQRRPPGKETPKSLLSFPIVAEGMADIIRAGGRGVLGEHGEQYGIGTHWELWGYAEALTPMEALKVATLDGAYFIGLENELGSITPGKLADLVVLDADPLQDIRNTAKIAYVMKGGRLYDDDTLAELWPERRRYLPVPWR